MDSAKISAATMINKEMIKVPQRAQIIPTIRPKIVTGYVSPYPTVVMVMITHQTESK